MVKCPFCAEEIREDAIKCRHCGEWLTNKNIAEVVSSPRLDDGSAVARAVTKGLKQKEADDARFGCGMYLALIPAVFAGYFIHWLVGVVIFFAILIALSKSYHKE